MNRKILLIENRPDRQKEYLPNGHDDVERFAEMGHFLAYLSFKEDLEKINQNDLEFLTQFELIIIHRSALGELSNGSAVNRIITFCKEFDKDLILFSGGISSSIYTEEGGRFLLINSKDFYSENLIPFFKQYHEGKIQKLIQLKYGKNWRLTYLLQLREYLALEKSGENYSKEIINIKEDILNLDNDQDINQEITKLIQIA
jgi:hypothetical protein